MIRVQALYDGDGHGNAARFPESALASSMARKRTRAMALARGLGVRSGRGVVVSVDADAIPVDGAAVAALVLDVLETPKVVADVECGPRQQIVQREDLAGTIERAARARGRGGCVALVVREFHDGDGGLLLDSPSGGVASVQHARAGLMALNRGHGAPDGAWVVSGLDREDGRLAIDGSPSAVLPVAPGELRTMARVAWAIEKDRGGPVVTEWVASGGRPVFVDFSSHATRRASACDATVLSPGTAEGPVVFVDASDELLELSNAPVVSVSHVEEITDPCLTALRETVRSRGAPPVVVSDRPLAVFALLAADVAGFVFRGGSTLSHLAIILRELGIPAIVASPPSRAVDRVTFSNGVALWH